MYSFCAASHCLNNEIVAFDKEIYKFFLLQTQCMLSVLQQMQISLHRK